MANKSKSFEQSLQKLEEIVSAIEDDDTSLDKSMKLYKEGLELSKLLTEKLNLIEKEVEMIEQTEDGFVLKPFPEA